MSSTIGTWLPFLNALRTPILLFSHSVMSDFSRTHGLQPTILWSLLKFTSMESVMLSNHLMLCCPLFLLLSIFHSLSLEHRGYGQGSPFSLSTQFLPHEILL